ncbi:MAG: VWA domain-containing protein [Pseudomonadota bacterium]
MDEKKLNETLSHLHAPEPSKEAQNQALAAAMAVFDKKVQEKTQGKAEARRLTGVDPFNSVRRFYMKKKYVLSGMAGAVSVAAIAAVLGTPFLTDQMSRISPVNMAAQSGAKAMPEKVSGNTAIPAQKKTEAIPATEAFIDQLTVVETTPKAQMFAKEKTLQMEMEDRAEGNVAVPSTPAKSEMAIDVINKPIDGEYNRADRMAERKAAPMMMALPSPAAPAEKAYVGGIVSGSIANMPFIADEQGQAYYKDVGRDKFEHADENSVKEVAAEPVSTFSIDVDTASYAFARKMINQGVLPQKDAVRVEEMINYFDYNYPLADNKEQPFRPTIAVYDSPWKPGNKIVHIGIKGYDVAPAEKPRSNLVFLLDVSGSMNSPDKLPLLRNSLKMLVETLNPEDTVGIVVYAGSAGTVLEPTKISDKQKILDALDRLQAGGSTAGAEGVRQAYNLAEQNFVRDGVNRVILATDGDFNVGITNQEELKDFIERKRDTGISLSVLGFGEGNYNDSMMQTLAQNGNGNAAFIDTLGEARKVLVQEASSTLFTIAKDVKIQVEFNPSAVKEYRLIGYETRALKREDFNNDKVDAGEIGSGHAVTALYEITPSGAPALVDNLRYDADKTKADAEDRKGGNEYAFLKIRYKLPKEDASRLIERPITASDEAGFDRLPDDIRFAAGVAGFGQLLKGGKYTGNLTYDKVIEIANNARGKDEFGYRTEFVNLVRLAKSAAAMQP